MRVLQVLLSPSIGGAETLADQLAKTWESRGVVTRIAYLDSGTDGSRRRVRWQGLHRQIDEFGPDVVVSHSALPNLYARLAARRDVPVVTVLHSAADDHANRTLWLAESLLRRRTAHVVAVSASQVDTYVSHFPRLAGKVTLIPNGVRGDLQPPERARQSVQVIGVLARIDRQKRPDVWVRAAEVLEAAYPQLRFLWWGTVPDEQTFAGLIGRPRVGLTNTAFVGATDSVPQALSNLDVYFHTADREAMSIALLEAAVCGLPIVCSDAVAKTLPPALVVDAFRAGDPMDAAHVLSSVVVDYQVRSERSRAIATKLGQDFSIERCAAQYLRLLEGITSGGIGVQRRFKPVRSRRQ